jgi:MFS family permease
MHATFAITQTRDFTLLLLIQIASGTVGGLSSGAFYALPAELVRKEYRGTALGVFNSLGRTAGAIGPLVGSLIVTKYSFELYPRFVFYASVLLGIPSIIIFAIFVKETLRKNAHTPVKEESIQGRAR